MMKQVVLICAILAVASAWQAAGFNKPIPEKFKGQAGCYMEDQDEVIPFGTSKSKTSCAEINCGDKMYTVVGCGSVAAAPPCKVVEDKTKLHPECCPKIQCP